METAFVTVRRLIITALFADEKLTEQLVLKGGNALSLVYELSSLYVPGPRFLNC